MAVVAFGLASLWASGPGSNTTSAQIRTKAYTAIDLGVVTDVGGLNNEPGNALTSVVAIPKTVNTAHLQIPTIFTLDGACNGRDTFQIDTQTGFGRSINDDRIVVGTRGLDAFEWFPDQCSGSTQRGPLPRLPNFDPILGNARANANNNARDTVGATAVTFVAGAAQDVPTLWQKVAGGFTVEQLQTAFRPAPFDNFPQPGEAFDINEQGTIVGFTLVGSSTAHRACIFRPGQQPQILQKVSFLTSFQLSEARGISNNGFITGNGTTTNRLSFGQTRAFVRSPAGLITTALIPDSDGVYVGAFGNKINSSGFAVGKVVRNDGGTTAALWNEDGHLAFLTLQNVDGLSLIAALTEAVDINDNGNILVKGSINGEAHAFVLRPNTGGVINFWPVSQSY
jgi:hypothetical protein